MKIFIESFGKTFLTLSSVVLLLPILIKCRFSTNLLLSFYLNIVKFNFSSVTWSITFYEP